MLFGWLKKDLGGCAELFSLSIFQEEEGAAQSALRTVQASRESHAKRRWRSKGTMQLCHLLYATSHPRIT